MIVEGQLHGGIVQGVGQALYESAVYDEVSGQLLSGSFMDYTMPRADHVPNMNVQTHSTRCTHTPMGVKGCGEVGTIGSPAAVVNGGAMRFRTSASSTAICPLPPTRSCAA